MNFLLTILIIAICIAIIIFWPFAIIWSLNTLFVMNIAYTFNAWLATVIMTSTFGAASCCSRSGSKSK